MSKAFLYQLAFDEAEQRACSAISEDHCQQQPLNFTKNAFSGFCSKLAEQLVSTGIVLPYAFNLLGVSNGLVGLLVPIKDAGSLLPQLVISGRIRSFSRRKYFWAIPALVQGLMVIAMLLASNYLAGNTAANMMIAALFFFSIASGISSVAFKDVLAKTIDKEKRGRLLATRATGGGLLTMLAGFYFFYGLQDNTALEELQVLFMLAALLWVMAAFFFAQVKEQPGATSGGRNPWQETRKGWQVLKEDHHLLRFILARAMLMAIPLALPFFVVAANQNGPGKLSGLGIMVIAAGLAATVSSPFWGKMADVSSRRLMIITCSLGIFNLLLLASLVTWADRLKPFQGIYTYAVLVLFQMMLHGGARLSRKTWLTNYAPAEERPLYISVANTAIGLFTLLAAGISLVAQFFNLPVLLLFFCAMLVLAACLAMSLPDA